jgi:hypothetical protein
MGKKGFDHETLLEIASQDKAGVSGRKIAESLGLHHSNVCRFLARETHLGFWEKYTGKPLAAGSLNKPHLKRGKMSSDKKAFIFTSAQNNTFVHSKLLKTLQVISGRLNAPIVVGTFTYDKGAYQKLQKGDSWYAPELRQYINDESTQVADDLVWCGELNILPTAANPISGLQNYTGSASSIIPHSKVNLESVASHKGKSAKMVYTTGCVTQSNFVKKKAGQKAEHHHIYGALLVEIDKDGTWFARQLIAETHTGNVYDLDTYYTPEGFTTGHRVMGINWGDIHAEKLCPVVGAVSFGVAMADEASMPHQVEGPNMLDDLRPHHMFYHDLTDFKVRNHHNRKNPLFKIAMMYAKTEEVSYGLEQAGKVLELTSRPWCQSVVVNSNHDAALQKWATEITWGEDPINAEFLLSCQLKLVRAIKDKDSNFCIFEDSLKGLNGTIDDVKFLRLDESYRICGDNGIQCGFHGHTGNNGARGSTQSYRLAGERFNIGHQHSANIRDGVYVAGVSGKLDMGYNVGMGGWSQSHIVTYKNAKRAIITIKGSRYKAKHHYIDGKWIIL